jgi:hypothetical protein
LIKYNILLRHEEVVYYPVDCGMHSDTAHSPKGIIETTPFEEEYSRIKLNRKKEFFLVPEDVPDPTRTIALQRMDCKVDPRPPQRLPSNKT